MTTTYNIQVKVDSETGELLDVQKGNCNVATTSPVRDTPVKASECVQVPDSFYTVPTSPIPSQEAIQNLRAQLVKFSQENIDQNQRILNLIDDNKILRKRIDEVIKTNAALRCVIKRAITILEEDV